MQKFVLMFAILFGFTLCVHAQNAGNGPRSSSTSTPSSTAPVQPVAFNHKLHIGTAKMTCNDCHTPRGDGSTLALPQASMCMKCHSSIGTDKPDIKRLAEAAKNEDPILWIRIYRVPSFVTFSHKTHVGNTCEECHGPVAERTIIAQEKDTNMGSCIACHQTKAAPATCDTCHAIMSTNGRSPFEVEPNMLAQLYICSKRIPTSTIPVQGTSVRVRLQFVLRKFLNVPML